MTLLEILTGAGGGAVLVKGLDLLVGSRARRSDDLSEIRARLETLQAEVTSHGEAMGLLRLQFAAYRQRVRVLISYFRDGNPAWRALAAALETDDDVDEALGVREIERAIPISLPLGAEIVIKPFRAQDLIERDANESL